eukprot:352084-Prymnesium_polylepis.1
MAAATQLSRLVEDVRDGTVVVPPRARLLQQLETIRAALRARAAADAVGRAKLDVGPELQQ